MIEDYTEYLIDPDETAEQVVYYLNRYGVDPEPVFAGMMAMTASGGVYKQVLRAAHKYAAENGEGDVEDVIKNELDRLGWGIADDDE